MATKLKPVSTIIMDFGLEEYGEGHKFFANECMRKMDKYVPMDEGTLREEAYVDSECNIVYEQPYARYMYYGKLMVDPETGSSFARKDAKKVLTNKDLVYHTPGTGPYWDQAMLSAESDDLVEEMANYIKKRGNK